MTYNQIQKTLQINLNKTEKHGGNIYVSSKGKKLIVAVGDPNSTDSNYGAFTVVLGKTITLKNARGWAADLFSKKTNLDEQTVVNALNAFFAEDK